MIDTSTSEILAVLQGKTAGTYDRMKNCEAKAGGRELPPNLKGAIGQATRIKLDRNDAGNPYAYLYATTCEPPEHRGVGCGLYLPLSADNFNSEEDNIVKFLATLKLLGYKEKIEQARGDEFWRDVFPFILDDVEKGQPCFEFKTGRERKSGSPNVLIQGLSANGYTPPATTTINQHASQGYAPVATAPAAPRKGPPVAASAPAKAPPGRKTPPKKDVCPVQIGDWVETQNDPYQNGVVYKGRVVGIVEAKREVSLEIEGDSGYEVGWADIKKIDSPQPSFHSGMAVKTHPDLFNNGQSYDGVIISVTDGKAAVKFTSGDVFDGENAIDLKDLIKA